MSNYGIDSHKLHLHPGRVAKWLEGQSVYPIYMEISPSGACNHRCVFCTMDFMGYKPRLLDADMLQTRLKEFGTLGVKSIMFAGEGEPLLHKDIGAFAQTAHKSGIDVSFTTNAVLLRSELVSQLLPVTSWIKVSCNAGTAEKYAATHRTDSKDFMRVMENMGNAVAFREKEKLNCTLGFQCILLPENAEDMPALARRVRDMGADYLVIKPYTRNPLSNENRYGDIQYTNMDALAEALQAEERNGFKVIFRKAAMQRWNEKKDTFDRCLALPFWAYLDSAANVWGCLRHLQEDRFHYGNLNESSFHDIWQGEKRRENLQWCEQNLDVHECHVTCRMEMINNYLWRLRNPEPHDNFI